MPIWLRGTITPSEIGSYNETTQELTVKDSVTVYPGFTFTKPVTALLSGAANLTVQILPGSTLSMNIGSKTKKWDGPVRFG